MRAGDRVGVAALSGPVAAEPLRRGIAALRSLGLRPVLAQNLSAVSREGLFAGEDDARLEAFHRLAADPSLRAIIFARGGYGVLRLLPDLDWKLLAEHPRAYVGYSDLTPFLLQVVERLGLVAFHGPMVASDLGRGLTRREAVSLLAALAGDYPLRLRVGEPSAWDSGDEVEGRLLGGCLSLLVATLGTPFFPRLADALLFLEDVGEPLYRLDRMLTHLRLSGNVNSLRGLLLGHLIDCEGREVGGEGWRRAVEEVAAGSRCPVVGGLACGHAWPNLTLPLGLNARLHRKGNLILG